MNSLPRTEDRGEGLRLLEQAQACYDNMRGFRQERTRNKRYTFGDQWGDTICVDGRSMTEGEYIRSQGRVPLKNNLIRRLVRNVLGVYRSQSKEPTAVARDRDEQRLGQVMSTVLQYNMQANSMQELLARCMEEFLISGFCVVRKSFGWRGGRYDCWTDVVQPDCFFLDTRSRDARGWDAAMCGQVHDIGFEDLCARFASTPEQWRWLSEAYAACRGQEAVLANCRQFGMADEPERWSLLQCGDRSCCRVVELWRKEGRPMWRCHDPLDGTCFTCPDTDKAELVDAVNAGRASMGSETGMDPVAVPLVEAEWAVEEVWRYYFLTPMGDILAQGESPYFHGSHPYVWKAYPFIDGEIHSFVADVVDQQRYTNRLITMYDWIMSASAKGVLLCPEECIPDGMTPEDLFDQWARFDGVVLYKASRLPGGQLPHQVSGNSTNIGVSELLGLQLKMFEDISGVNGALQGKPGYSSTSGTLYAQQTQNATMSLLDMLECFSDFVKAGAMKDVKNIQQCYDTPRMVSIAGESARGVRYDPATMADVEFDLSIAESTATPAYRQLANEFLLQLWQSQAITVEQLLEQGDFPFADQLLQSIKSRKEEQAQAQAQGQETEGQ